MDKPVKKIEWLYVLNKLNPSPFIMMSDQRSIDMLRDLETALIPEWAVVAIINNDYSGLNSDDELLIESWLESKYSEHGTDEIILVKASEYADFCYANDMTDTGDDCVRVYLFAQSED